MIRRRRDWPDIPPSRMTKRELVGYVALLRFEIAKLRIQAAMRDARP